MLLEAGLLTVYKRYLVEYSNYLEVLEDGMNGCSLVICAWWAE